MNKLLPAVLLVLHSDVASATGINLSWNDCGRAGTLTQMFACNANTGSNVIVASFVPPPNVNQFLGLSSEIDISTGQAALPDWWKHGTGQCRGTTGLSASFDFTSGPYTCADFYTGAAAGGLSYDVGYSSPDRARLRIQGAVSYDSRGPVDPATEYYAYKVSLLHSKTVGTDGCSGCATPACILLKEIQLFQPPELAFDPIITNPIDRQFVTWQSTVTGLPDCPVVNPSPVAALTATPSSGNVPISIAFSAAGSTDDGSIVSYRFVFGDGSAPVGPQASATTTHVYSTAGTYTATVTVTDNLGATGTASKTLTLSAPSNLVTNPGFESNLTGWAAGTNGPTLSRVAGGHSGGYAAQLKAKNAKTFGMTDNPDVITSVVSAGITYRLTAWVRSASNKGQIKIAVRELVGSKQQGTTAYSTAVALSSTWNAVSFDYVTRAAGSHLDVEFQDYPAASGEKFLIDDISFTKNALPAAMMTRAAGDDGAGAQIQTEPAALEFAASVSPNPSHGDGVLYFTLTRPEAVELRIFDVAGRLVSPPLERAFLAPGNQRIQLPASEVSRAGIYFYRLSAAEGEKRGAFVVIR